MLTTPEVVVFLPAGMAGQTGLRDFFRRFVLERNHLGGVAFFYVGLAWSMTTLTTGCFPFPTLDFCDLSV